MTWFRETPLTSGPHKTYIFLICVCLPSLGGYRVVSKIRKTTKSAKIFRSLRVKDSYVKRK